MPNTERANELLNKADALFSTANFEQSFELYSEAAAIFEEEEEQELFIETRTRIGRYYIKHTQYDEALYYINETVELAILELSAHHNWVGYSYDHIGTCYYYKGIYYTAIEFYNKALSQRLQAFGEVHEMTARCYNNIGNCYLSLDNIPVALDYYQKALTIRKELLDEGHLSFAYTYTAIGACLMSQGEHNECLEYYKKALSIRKELYGNEHPQCAYSLGDIGAAYQEIGDYQQALEYVKKALAIRVKVFGDNHHTTSASYSQYGEIFMKMGKDEAALESLEKSLQIKKNLYGNIHPEIAEVYKILGCFYFQKNDYFNSNKNYQKEFFILTQIHGTKHQSLAENNINFAKINKEKKSYKRALLNCQKALTNLQDNFNDLDIYKNPQEVSRTHYATFLKVLSLKAKLFDQLYEKSQNVKDLSFARETWTLCLQVITKIRNSYLTENAKINLAEKVVDIYENALLNIVESYMNTDDEQLLETAFSIAEKGRSSALFAHLKQVEARQSLELPDDIRKKEINIRTQLTQIDLNIAIEKNKKENSDKKQIEQLENEHFEANRKYEKLIKSIENNYPDYFELKYKTNTVNVKELQKELKENSSLINSCILEYFIVKNKVFIFVIKKDNFKIIPIKINDDLIELINDYNESISFVEFEDYYAAASQLYQYFIEPIKAALKGINKLIIIRDSLLGAVSFDAFVNPEKAAKSYTDCQYLIQEYEIAYHYSASLMMNSLSRQTITQNKETTFLGLAPVDFSDGKEIILESGRGQTKVMRKVGIDGELHDLPKSAEEVEQVFRIFESHELSAKMFIYDSATKENLLKNATESKFMLIATHGFTSESDNLSGIILSNPKSKEHDVLYTTEVYNIRLDADLVVLSSCSSGIGKLLAGEGMMSLNRGFLFAGASNVIFTQFDIPDQSSSILVKQLFRHILSGDSYAKALQKAKLHFIQNARYSPQDWTGFALLGI